MKSLFATLLFSCVLLIGTTQAQLAIVVEHAAGGSSAYSSLQTALDNSENGDVIYLPGTYITSSVTINRAVHIIGVGHYPDSTAATGRTEITGNVILLDSASGGSITGVFINGNIIYGTSASDQTVTNFILNRSSVGIIQMAYSTSSSVTNTSAGIYVSESIVRTYIDSQSARHITVRNSIITQGIFDMRFGNITNVIFLAASTNSSTSLSATTKSTFKNCVFTHGISSLDNSNTLLNCGFASTPSGPIVINPYSISATSMFENYDGADFEYTHNYHIVSSETTLLTGGTDGTQIGIYGSGSPYIDGAIPFQPRIIHQNIGAITGSDGKLPVNIKVEARDQ